MRSSTFFSYRHAQEKNKKRKKEEKERLRENITMAVNTESNEYSKATYKMKNMRYKIVRDSFMLFFVLYKMCI